MRYVISDMRYDMFGVQRRMCNQRTRRMTLSLCVRGLGILGSAPTNATRHATFAVFAMLSMSVEGVTHILVGMSIYSVPERSVK